MNEKYEKQAAQSILTQYTEKAPTRLDELRALDKKVKRPALVVGYTLGAIGAIVMGSGMSLVMTDIGAILDIPYAMPIGIAVGVVGMLIAGLSYPVGKKILSARKKKYAGEISRLSHSILENGND